MDNVVQETIMRKIIACVLTWFMALTTCMAVGDAVSERRSNDKVDAIKYMRDGKKILTITLYRRDQPEKQILRQIIWLGETKIAEIVNYHGVHSYLVMPNVPVSVGIEHSETGDIKNVVLMDDSLGMVECFKVENDRLQPILGHELMKSREITQDLQGLFDAVQKQEDTPEEFESRITGIVLKHSQQQDAQQAESTVSSEAAPNAVSDVP